MKKGPVTKVGPIEVYRISGTGHYGSRGTGAGWWAKVPNGLYLAESQAESSWPPYPVHAYDRSFAKPVKTKREMLAMVTRYLDCPWCGEPARESEVSAWMELPKYPGFPMGPTGDRMPAAAQYRCANDHLWVKDIPRR